MGRESGGPTITATAVQAWLRAHRHPDAVVTRMRPLGREVQAGLKDYGYGRPLQVSYRSEGDAHELVLRTMSPDPFGHDRRADRVANLILAQDTFDAIPGHIRPIAVGTFAADGSLVPMAPGEPFLVTDYVEGRLYAEDLHLSAPEAVASARDLDRAMALGRYLAELHGAPAAPEAYRRDLRDTVGSGEGIFGLCDSYPADDPVAPPARLEAIEHAAVRWRWRLAERTERARRTHGDFHPFNLLFREGSDLSALDCSRGAAGDPADDVTCLSINYLFFALVAHGEFTGALRGCWDAFWSCYLEADRRWVLEAAPLYFTWRALVLASPVWYPDIPRRTRERLLGAAERLLDGAPFDPEAIERWWA